LIAHPETGAKSLSKSISDIKKKLTSITRFKNGIILVGPEAGFTLAEVALAKSNLYIPFNLGNRRLRSETAGIVSTAIMMEMIES